MTDTDRLSTNQRRAIEALLSKPTVRAAAKKAKLGEATLYRYLRDETFRAELSRRQDAVVAAVTAALCGRSGEAVETLSELLKGTDASPAVRARVALGILSQTRQAVELSDLAERVAKLEAVNK